MKKYIKDLIHPKVIKIQMIYSNITVICIIASIVCMINYSSSYKNIKQIEENGVLYHINTLQNQCNIAYEQVRNLVLNCTERGLFNAKDINSRHGVLTYNKLLSSFLAVTAYGGYIDCLMIADHKGNFVQITSLLGSKDDYKNIVSSDWFSKEMQKIGDNYQLSLVASPFYQAKDPILPMVKPFPNNQGWVIACLSSTFYQDILKANNNENEIYIFTSEGKQVAALNSKEEHIEGIRKIAQEIKLVSTSDKLERVRVNNKLLDVFYSRDLRSGIMMIEIMGMKSIREQQGILILTAFFIFLACIIVGIGLSIFFTKKLSKPISRLSMYIQQISEGNFLPNPTIEGTDEIGKIGKAMNSMAEKIHEYMNRQLEIENEKRNLEIKMLQAQINPHFLYNTLDSVRWIATIQKNTGIVKVVTALIRLLKNMAKGFDEKVTIRQEIEFLNDYVVIQKIKYIEIFEVEFNIQDDSLYDAKIIKLTLQPLVENAIFSGIKPNNKMGLITVTIKQDKKDLIIYIKDNGVGMTQHQINRVLISDDELNSDKMNGIGLNNVNQRIKINYGSQYGLSIKSEVDKFTEITVRIPLER